MNRLIASLFLCCLALPVLAHEAKFGVRGESLPVHHLTIFRAQVGETEETFVSRVGTFLDRYSAANGFEACAALVLEEDLLVARVTTNESHVGCVATIRTGAHYTGRSIHSHPPVSHVKLNLADNIFLRGDRSRQGPARLASMRTRSGVSPTDRLSGEGYLVEGGGVVFFSPGRPDRTIGPVAASPLPATALSALPGQ